MSGGLKKLLSENGVAVILLGIVVVYLLFMFFKYLDSKGRTSESMGSTIESAYSNDHGNAPSVSAPTSGEVQPSEPSGTDGSFAPAGGSHAPMTSQVNSVDSTNLLPNDTNSDWSKTNPMGTGNLANLNLLKAGEHIGINTVGSTMKNPNLQLRSEPTIPKPTVPIVWNQSTYETDLMRPSFEIGNGSA